MRGDSVSRFLALTAVMLLVATLVTIEGCYRTNADMLANRGTVTKMERQPVREPSGAPEYLQRWPGLFERHGDRIVDAPPEDVEVAKGYPNFAGKGTVVGGTRLTIMCRSNVYRVGEPLRVLHVLEVPEPGHKIYVMGPKKIYGEYVDGRLATPAQDAPEQSYDGRVLDSPAVDYNYDVTHYTFSEPGRHTISWQMGDLRSNTLEIDVVAQ